MRLNYSCLVSIGDWNVDENNSWALLLFSGALGYLLLRFFVAAKNKESRSCPTSSQINRALPSSKNNCWALQDSSAQWHSGHLYECIQSRIESTRCSRIKFALMLLELGNCGSLQASLSVQSYNTLLQRLESQLRGCSPVIEHCSRTGESRFSVIVTAGGAEHAAIVAQKLLRQFSLVDVPAGQEQPFSCSIGICQYHNEQEDPELLLQRAEQALCHAKQLGSGYFCFFDEVGRLLMSQREQQVDRLKIALQQKELRLHYQPVISLQSRQIVGLEALIRWQHPQQGLIAPLHFIPLAEQTGLIVAIGEWVIRNACGQLKRWQREASAPSFVAVNVSLRQLACGDLVDIVRHSLTVSGLQPEALELEITESLAMGNLECTIKQLQELRELGVEASIDDFGTGHSSLSYLKHLPVQKLKIDRSFIRGIHNDLGDAAIVESIIDLAHGLGLIVVAEGVEYEAQYQILKDLGCDYAQGYLFSKPLAALEVEVMLRNNKISQDNGGTIPLSVSSGVI